jgi:hypothetical protein
MTRPRCTWFMKPISLRRSQTRAGNRRTTAVLVAIGALLLGASVTLAKEGATVALTDPIPRDADPGSTLTVEFTVMVPGENRPTPMVGSPVFVQLVAPDGTTSRGFGTEDRGRPGTYRAEVVVPAGGIASAEFGLRGSTDMMFVVQGQLFASGKPPAAPLDPSASSPAASGAVARPPILISLGGLLLAGLVLATRRRRLTPGAR